MSFFTSLFGSKKTVSVSSTVYNLAGAVATRPNFLKTTLAGAVLSSSDLSIAEQLSSTYLAGPGIQLRSFARWAQNYGYSSLVGLGSAPIYLVSAIDPAVLTPLLPTETGTTTVLQDARIGAADFVFWVEQYMTENYPTLIDTDYTCDLDATTNVVTITFVDTTTATFTITGFNVSAQYLYATYIFSTPAVPVTVPPGTPTSSALQYLAYEQNTGNSAFDALFVTSGTAGYFFPFIPIRVNSTFISPTFAPAIYTAAVKATKKATGGSYDAIVASMKTNASVGNIDYAYIVFGVSINTQENAALSYIYQFFLAAMSGLPTTYTNYAVCVASAGFTYMNYNMTVMWDSSVETFGSGVLTNATGANANAGDVWFTTLEDGISVRLNWQVDASTWRYLTITNLTHVNLIYAGNAVATSAVDGLASATDSGFIFPLNQGIYESISLINSTQVSTACCLIVCNSYTVTTEPWYETNLFKVLLIVAVIAVVAFTANPAAIGLLGSNAAVGVALGLTATSAAMVGAVVNTLAAMILVQLVSSGSSMLFGQQFGAIIGAIAGLVMLQVGTALMNGTSAAQLLNTLTQPMNLLKLTEAAGNGYAQFMQIDANKINASTQTMLNDYSKASANLTTQYEQMFGQDGGADLSINPLALTDVNLPNVHPNVVLAETPESFFSRTLLSGSDIASLSMDFVNNFCDASLSTLLLTDQT